MHVTSVPVKSMSVFFALYRMSVPLRYGSIAHPNDLTVQRQAPAAAGVATDFEE
jgi:hypothetical protein